MTGVAQIHRYRHRSRGRGGVRIEYIIAAVVCVALLVAMTVVLVSVSSHKSKLEQAHRPISQQASAGSESSPAPAPVPAPRAPQQASPAPVPAPVAQQGGQMQPGAVEVVVEDAPQVATATPAHPAQAVEEAPVVVVDVPQQPVTSARGAFPDGRPWAIAANAPTRIQAEDFDTGGEGAAYHEVTGQNEGNQYRTSEAVDIEACNDTDSKYAVSNIKPGEWMEYTLNVEQSGTYVIRLRASRGAGGDSKAKLLFGGMDATGDITIPSTGDWQRFASVERDNVELSAGQQVMRVETSTGDFNLNWIEIIPAQAYVAPVVTSDKLELLKIGGRPAGSDWDFGVNGGTVSIQQSPQENSKCLRLLDNNRNASVWALRKFPKQSAQAGFECRIRFGQIADGCALGIVSGDKPAVLILTSGNELGCEVGSGEWKALQRYDANTWYTIRVSMDIKGKKYNVYVDGVQRGEGLAFRNGVDGVDAWQVETPVKNVGTLYISSMKVTEH